MILCIAGALVFACAATLGTLLAAQLCASLAPLPDGPQTGSSPDLCLILGGGLLGAVIAASSPSTAVLAIGALGCAVLAAIWHADVTRGIIPDWFTLGPIAVLSLAGLVTHRYGILFGAALPFVPFALLAYVSRGRGLGWGDAKLAALGGALVGVSDAILAFALASGAAAAVSYVRSNRGTPIAMAPYLVSAIALAMGLHAVQH